LAVVHTSVEVANLGGLALLGCAAVARNWLAFTAIALVARRASHVVTDGHTLSIFTAVSCNANYSCTLIYAFTIVANVSIGAFVTVTALGWVGHTAAFHTLIP
jgi:hypothetical protein